MLRAFAALPGCWRTKSTINPLALTLAFESGGGFCASIARGTNGVAIARGSIVAYRNSLGAASTHTMRAAITAQRKGLKRTLLIRFNVGPMGQCCLDQIFRDRLGYRIVWILECLFSQCDGLLVLANELRAVPAHLQVQPTAKPLLKRQLLFQKIKHEIVELFAGQHVNSSAPIRVRAKSSGPIELDAGVFSQH